MSVFVAKFRSTAMLCMALLISTPILCQDAAKAHVAIVRFSNDTGSSSFDAACMVATETLTLTMEQIGRYVVQSLEKSDSGETGLQALAETEHFDFIMYGSMSKLEAGGVECELAVFDRAKGKTALRHKEKAAGVLDIFEVSDDLVVSVLESMTGSHIGFGSVALSNSGEAGHYSVLVDGYPVGDDLQSVDRVLIGKHIVTITQKRMLGARVICKAGVDVAEGGTAEVSFTVPMLMDDEKAKLDALQASIRSGWNDPAKSGEVDARLAELSSLLSDTAYSPKLAEQRNAALQLGGEWILRKCRIGIEGAAWEPALGLLDAARTVYQNAKNYPDPRKIEKTFEGDAFLVATLFELAGGKALGDGDLAKGLECFENALMVSTRYLNGARLTDYAYALTMLQGMQSNPGAQTDQTLKLVFGRWIDAGARFYGLRNQVASGAACLIVASDFSRQLSVDGAGYAEAPFVLAAMTSDRTLAIQPKDAGSPLNILAPADSRLVFVQDGFGSFGKVALETAPGAIAVHPKVAYFAGIGQLQDQPAIEASLDGGDLVGIPHTFEGVPAGAHTVRIPSFIYGSKLIRQLEESVTVESGKRLDFSPQLEIARSTVNIVDIPAGASLQCDGIVLQTKDGGQDGTFSYSGTVDAGHPRIEVVKENRDWLWTPIFLADGASRTQSVRAMRLQVSLQEKTIRFKGKSEDWAGVDPIFGATASTPPGNIKGSTISGGCLCRDKRNIYVRIDFSDGSPDMSVPGARALQFSQYSNNSGQVDLEESTWPDGSRHADIWFSNDGKAREIGSYMVGPSFLELSFPISWFASSFDLTKPIEASLYFWIKSTDAAYGTPAIDVLLGN